MRVLPIVFIISLLITCTTSDPSAGLTQEERNREAFIDSLIQEMTLTEKLGQMSQTWGDGYVTGPVVAPEASMDLVREGKLGSFLNLLGAEHTRATQEVAVNESRLGIPLIFGYDIIHGYATTFPIPLAETASWDLSLIQRSAEIAAKEGAAAGQHWTFAPMVDISRDPRWGRIMEGAGEDPWYGGEVAAARVRGFQGSDLSSPNTIAACVKHFAGYGAAEGGRDYNTTEITNRTLLNMYLPPFEAAIRAGSATLMNGFNDLGGIPVTGSTGLVRGILKDEWNFQGYVVSDWASIEEMHDHGIAADTAEAAWLGLQAGVDMEMASRTYATYLPGIVNEQPDALNKINDAVRRVLRVKYDLGLFEDPFRYHDVQREAETLLHPDHIEHAREIARQSIVLLENRNRVLPLSQDLGTIAVIGSLAEDKDAPLGNWRAQGRAEAVTPILTGIKEAAGSKTRVLYAKGYDFEAGGNSGFNQALSIARRADVVVAVVGEHAWMSGEARIRSDIDLPEGQLDLLKELKKTGKPVVVLLKAGRQIAEPWMYENCDAIMKVWHLGVQEGPAVADVLFGKYNPSGKLPVTIPRAVGQVPIYYNHKNTGRPAHPDDIHTSKYLDIHWSPQYPFGYGLSYTSFEYSDLTLDKSELVPEDSITVSVSITNTGELAGEEVVQFYVRDLYGTVTRPVLELKGFDKVLLAPGESQRVTFSLKPEDLRFWNRVMEFATEPGDFKVYVGPNSADLISDSFTYKL